MESLVANLSNKVTRRTLGGRSYLVAPVVMIVEGVFAGNQGPLYYSGKEISRAVSSWNNKPITVGHPTNSQGQYVSASVSEVLDRFSVGMILNTRWDSSRKKLRAEAWFDEARLNTVDGGAKILLALNDGTPLEVSTGLFVDNKLTQNGSMNGRAFVGEAVNHRPDHLAVILQGVGACSIQDGAGLLVNAQASIESQIAACLQGKDKALYPLVLNADASTNEAVFIYNNSLVSENFVVESDSVKLLGVRTQFEARDILQGLAQHNKALKVSKEKLQKALGDKHAEFVANLSQEQVDAILALEKTVEVQVEKVVEKTVTVNQEFTDLNSVLGAISGDLRAQVEEALAVNANHRKSLIDAIVASPANKFSAEELSAYTTDALGKLSALAVNAAQATQGAQGATASRGTYLGSPASGAASAKPAPQKGFLPPASYVPAQKG